MSTLLLRLSGPMQSWGTQSRFSVRDTGLEPSKSGAVGLLCAAMGLGRNEPVDHIARLRMGVRVDREGILTRDYQTAQNIAKATGKTPKLEGRDANFGVVSDRYYLADAAFLVGLEGEDLGLLKSCQQALANPAWPLYLGRKAFPPGEPPWLPNGLQEGLCLEEALSPNPGAAAPWTQGPGQVRPDHLRVVLEDPDGDEVRSDQPVGSAFATRRFALRRVRTMFWSFDDARRLMEMGP